MEVRPVRSGEFDRLGAITVEAYTTLPGHVPEPDYEAELADVAGRANDATVLVALAEDGCVLGGVTLVTDSDSPLSEHDVAGAASIRMLAVDQSARGRGVGEGLVRACLDRAADAGATAIVLHSTPWMHGAHRLYDRLGFRRDPALDWTPVPGIDLLGFRKEI